MKEILPGLYVETKYDSGNVGLILTGAGAICVDVPMMPADFQDWMKTIKELTQEPISLLIQTDCNRERVLCAGLLNVPIVAHNAAWDKMKIYKSEKRIQQIRDLLEGTPLYKSWTVRMPDITFTERLILNRGSREILVLYACGHSAASLMVYLPENRLVFAGDLVYDQIHPNMAQAQTKEWLTSLNQLRKLVVDIIVPGHGPVCDKECTYALSNYIRDMRAKVRKCFQAGRSKSETFSLIMPEFIDAFPYLDSERDIVRKKVKGASDRIYDEYRMEARSNNAAETGSSTKKPRSRKRSGRQRSS